MRIILTLTFIAAISFTAFSQDVRETRIETRAQAQVPTYSYAYISVEGKILSKKLKVEVDLGDTPEQIREGEEYSEILTNKKSYAAILNYMVESQYELVETLERNYSKEGTGGTAGIIFIMKKRNN
ncbi:hypothetical protein EDD80_11649 [Anseongella ginsenosidimutans]|uniref:Uncharacterized protein n=1 Tax=Anseongella ginsenosidimutans TaxID=496056 RepID=A0A4V2UTA2_9SPHI|nr:hypothetical protein [Anseongella ginsenosidimutans]QEC53812.1 hypothetical protein FRZ59_16705 [Anseongella ginsenosidimutans]TCS84957.1 hypothetical protein EDD80_11649 [Anseongella ginsenosidimutans]